MFESSISLTINTDSQEVHDAVWARFQKLAGELCGPGVELRLSPDCLDLTATVSEDFGALSDTIRHFPLL